MYAVIVAPSPEMLEERRRLGRDRFDEVWEGVLHMVPPPSGPHQRLGTQLIVVLAPRVQERGLVMAHDAGYLRPGQGWSDYRQPDLIVARPEAWTDRGVEGPAELAIEIRSPDDETYEKIPFYEQVGTRELLIIEPTRREVELYVLRAGRLRIVQPDTEGRVRCESLGVTVATTLAADGTPRLMLGWDDGDAAV